LLVTNKVDSAVPSANYCEGQLQTLSSLSVNIRYFELFNVTVCSPLLH